MVRATPCWDGPGSPPQFSQVGHRRADKSGVTTSRPSRDRGRFVTETLGFAAFALAASAGLALALWLFAVPAVIGAATSFGAVYTTQGRVVACSTDVVGPPCSVEYTDPAGQVVTRPLERAGLVGVTTNERVALGVTSDGSVHVAGWRPWVDAALLVALALALTRWSVRWFARLLRLGDPHEAEPLQDLGPPARSTSPRHPDPHADPHGRRRHH